MLRFMMSWYDGVDLGRLDAMRAGSGPYLESLRDAILHRASAIASFVSVEEFVPDTSGNVDVEEDEGVGGANGGGAGGAGDQDTAGGDQSRRCEWSQQ